MIVIFFKKTFVTKAVLKRFIHHLILEEAKDNKLSPTARISEG